MLIQCITFQSNSPHIGIFYRKNLKPVQLFPPWNNPDMCLFFKQSVGSTGADDSNFRQKQGGGDSERTLSKPQKWKSKQTLAGLKGREF